MTIKNKTPISALRGAADLSVQAVKQVTEIVEGMHANISAAPLPFGQGTDGRTRGITGFVYKTIQTITGGVGWSISQALQLIVDEPVNASSDAKLLALQSAVNGVVGDYLHAHNNPLALDMQFRSNASRLNLNVHELGLQLPEAKSRLVIGIHGLCMNDLQWTHKEHNHVESLAVELNATPVYLLYNSGRHISENGHDFAELLNQLVTEWPQPIEEVIIVAHSMGGLVTRSALAQTIGAEWHNKISRIVFLGTPHHGAPMERGGNWFQHSVGISPYTAPLARLGMLRSSGITDLRHSNVLPNDWQGRDRFEDHIDHRQPCPLPEGIECFAVAARIDPKKKVLGDGLVPVSSAFGKHDNPAQQLAFKDQNRFYIEGVNHWALLSNTEIFKQLQSWLSK